MMNWYLQTYSILRHIKEISNIKNDFVSANVSCQKHEKSMHIPSSSLLSLHLNNILIQHPVEFYNPHILTVMDADNNLCGMVNRIVDLFCMESDSKSRRGSAYGGVRVKRFYLVQCQLS